MRKFFLASFATVATLAMATSAFALTKTPVADTLTHGGWNAAATCSIVYYNRCTLWSWGWSGFGNNNRYGVCADKCCNGSLAQTVNRVFTGAPPGYGFTGVVTINNADANCCPTNQLGSQAWLPTGPFDTHNWNIAISGAKFCVMYTFGPAGSGPGVIGTDHPAHGPTGPQACGFCYPLTRVNHTYFWGATGSPLCPGSTFNDGICDAQARVDIFMNCIVAVEPQSWGQIKNLYR
jgi:hypothetical protein